MARVRMITNEICKDKKVNSLADDTSRLAFTWLITFADREGRTYGDPAIVRSMLFPRRDDVTIERMTEYLTEWAQAGLIVWYEADGDLYIWFPSFEKNQVGLRKSREPASTIPEIPDGYDGNLPEVIRQLSGNLQDDFRTNDRLKDKIRKDKIRKDKIVVDVVFKSYENEIGLLSPGVSDELKLLSQDYPEEWLVDAIRMAAEQNVRKLSYIKGILKNRANGDGGTPRKQAQQGQRLPDGI